MKKILFTLTLALVALAGCKKDPGPGQTPDTPTTIGSLLGEWRGQVYGDVTIGQGGDENSIKIGGFPNSAAIGLEGYVMPDNTIRIPKQTFDEVYYPIDTGYDEPVYYHSDFIPLNGDELVISYDSDHIYISDAFKIGKINLLTGKYGTYRGEADTLIRNQ